jgi:hypothetical protein
MDSSLAIALSVFIISYALLASERINRTVVVALAFLLVVSPGAVGAGSPNKCENSFSSADAPRLHTAEVAGSNLALGL